VAQEEKELEDDLIDQELGKATDAVSIADEFSWDTLLVDEVDSE